MLTDTAVTCIVGFASFFAFLNSIFCGFVFDDLPAVVQNNDLKNNVPWSNLLWNDFWGTPMSLEKSHKSYRPFTAFTFRVNRLLFGDGPWSYHAVNVLLHTVVSILYLKLCLLLCKFCSRHMVHSKAKSFSSSNHHEKRFRESVLKEHNRYYEQMKKTAYFASVLFALHPVHCEAVTGVVGRAELLSAFFMIATILCYAKSSISFMFLSSLFCVFAVASKEQGITVIAVCVVFDFFVAYKLTPMELVLCRKSSNIYTGLRTAVLSLVGFCVLWWRIAIMRSQLPSFTDFDNPASASQSPSRQLTYNYILALNAKILLSPDKLLCDWAMDTVPLVEHVTDARNILTLLFWCILFIAAWKGATKSDPYAKLILMSLSLLAFPFIPASNLFFPVGFVLAERVLYVPSMGYCLLVAVGIQKLISYWKYLKNAVLFLFTLILLCHAWKTISRNKDWVSDYTLFQSGLQVTESNAKIWNNVGHSLEAKNPRHALLYFMEAAKVQPNDLGSHMNVGRTMKILGDTEGAEKAYLKAKELLPKAKGKEKTARIAPDHLQLFVYLGNLLKVNHSRLPEADALYKEAIAMRSDFADAYINRGEILMLMNRMEEATESYRAALQFSKKKDDIYFNLGVVYSQMGNVSGAVEQYTYAIQENPNHIKALYNSAAIFEETRDPDLLRRSKIRTERILALEPDNYLAHSLLGSIYLDNNDEKNAAKCWKKVLKIQPNDKSALFNMAFMYSKTDKTKECIHYVEELLIHHPNHVKGLMLYGDMLLTKKKDTKRAASAFSRAIEANPKNIEARHNYCVVILEEGRLEDAERCMHDVYLMAPQEQYVSDNLSIIRRKLAKYQKEKEDEQLLKFTAEDSRPQSTMNLDEKKTSEDSEDFIYVEPPPKKIEIQKPENAREKSITERARDILNNVQSAARLAAADSSDPEEKLSKLESALKEVRDSVGMLNSLNDELDQVKTIHCSKTADGTELKQQTHTGSLKETDEHQTNDEVDKLKNKALNFLDELEKKL